MTVENLLHHWKRMQAFCYTAILRRSFLHWGIGSRIAPPVTLRNAKAIQIGDNVRIREHAWLNVNGLRDDGKPTLEIGDRTYIGRFAQINANQEVKIGSNVLIADRVYISDADHVYLDKHFPIRSQGIAFKGPVNLCSGCWIGIGVVILPGVTVGRNAIVAANAVVTEDVPDYCITGGIPARVIKTTHDRVY